MSCTMELTPDDIRHVAALARLDLSEDEINSLGNELSAILTYIEKLDELDTSEVEPTSHVVSMKTPFRKDEVTNSPSVEDALANAPQSEDDFFVVPSIIE